MIGLLAWGVSVYAEKRLATAMFIEPRNYSDWLMIIMFKPISLLISGSLILVSIYLLYRLCRRQVYSLLLRRIFPGMERGIHIVIWLYGVFLLFILGSKFPWVVGVFLSGLFLYDLVQLVYWHRTRDSS